MIQIRFTTIIRRRMGAEVHLKIIENWTLRKWTKLASSFATYMKLLPLKIHMKLPLVTLVLKRMTIMQARSKHAQKQNLIQVGTQGSKGHL